MPRDLQSTSYDDTNVAVLKHYYFAVNNEWTPVAYNYELYESPSTQGDTSSDNLYDEQNQKIIIIIIIIIIFFIIIIIIIIIFMC